MVKNGEIITPLLTDSVLESITRDTVIQIAKDILGISVIERSIDRTELYVCDEVFLCGSSMEITPVLFIDKYAIGLGITGCITSQIHKIYLETVSGIIDKYMCWITSIY